MSTRSRTYAFGLLAVGGVAGLVVSGRPWWIGTAEGSTVSFTGTQSSAGLSQAVPLVLLAGTLLALALRARGRRVVGVLLALAAAGGVVAGLARPAPPRELVLTRLQTITLGDQYALRATAWPYAFALTAALALVGAALLVVRAGTWPTRARRFERTADAPADPEPTDELALWRAIDAGADPTDGPGPEAAGRPPSPDQDPIRTTAPDGDTMRAESGESPEHDPATTPDSAAVPAPVRRHGSEGNEAR